MRLTEEEYEWISENKEEVRKIAISASSSSITAAFREGIVRIGKAHNLISCSVCNSALYMACCSLYGMFVEDFYTRQELAKKKGEKNGSKKKFKGGENN